MMVRAVSKAVKRRYERKPELPNKTSIASSSCSQSVQRIIAKIAIANYSSRACTFVYKRYRRDETIIILLQRNTGPWR